MGNIERSDKSGNLKYEDFFKKAILTLRDITKSMGIHSVYSGFNNAFRQYYGENPVQVTQDLARKGTIEIQPRKGGIMIYLPGEAPKSRNQVGKEALLRILGEKNKDSENVFQRVIEEILPAEKTNMSEDSE
jgi:hypothetical protein